MSDATLADEISVAELKRLHDAGRAFVLLDVREDDELALARIVWAKHVPMDAVPERLTELPRDGNIVVMCHGGVRSERVARYLRHAGFTSVANLAGGIDAWSHEIDPSVPLY
ncbi:MAG: rhodanese-like domain-containing protein [Vulcanimicrobiaceae bacterium]